jgi:hypothetical protein
MVTWGNKKNTVKCTGSKRPGIFCEACFHAEPHEESLDCIYREEAIKPERRRICNCLNYLIRCEEVNKNDL